MGMAKMASLGNMCATKSGLIVKLSRMSLTYSGASPGTSFRNFHRLLHGRNSAAGLHVWRRNNPQTLTSHASSNVKWTFISPVSGNLFYSTETADSKEKQQDSDNKKDANFFKRMWRWITAKENNGKKMWLALATLFTTTGMAVLLAWGPPPMDPEGNLIIDEFSSMPWIQAYFLRAWKNLNAYVVDVQEPSLRKLLPDPLQYPYHQPKYTLVIELPGVLVHPEWTVNSGWRFKKRPGVDAFLQRLILGSAQQLGEKPPDFEIVVYTKESGMSAAAVLEGLDKQGFIMYRLFRDSTRYMKGVHVKDLDYLNRDLSKIIVVEWDPKAVQLHPRNAMLLPKWEGADDDRQLSDLASFLLTIAATDVDDVRTVLDHYSSYDQPLEAFKENQRKLQEETVRAKEQAQQKSLAGSWSSKFTRR